MGKGVLFIYSITKGFNLIKCREIRLEKQLSIPDAMPILYGINFSINNGPVRFTYPKDTGTYYIIARVTTAGVAPRQFLFSLTYDGEKMDIHKGEHYREI